MGRYDGYLLCSDLDGTFLNRSKKLIDKNLKAIEYFIEEGGLFTLSTGRMPTYLTDNFNNKIKINTYLICFNGTVIYDLNSRKNIYEKSIDRDKISDMNIKEKEYKLMCKEISYYTDYGSYNTYELIGENEKIHKIVYDSVNEEDCNNLRNLLENKYGEICDFNKSWSTGLEMIPKNSGKGDCIKHIRKVLKGKINKVIAVGDYENDITMLEEADIGYAVANAVDCLKKVADKVTVSNDEGAIAKIIEEI